MNEPKSTQEIKELFRAYDRDRNGKLTLDEFCAGMLKYAAEKKNDPSVHRTATVAHDSDEEHEEVPDEFAENKFKSVADQQRAIRGAAARLCLAGTALVLVFSDPITDVLQTGADRMGIPAFYVGFVVAPLITNGSEVLASYTFAQKKTRKAMVVAYEQLLGAAVMNNTFCLAVFAALIYFQDLVWTYTAETVAILFAAVWKSTSELGDNVASMAWGARNLVSTQVRRDSYVLRRDAARRPHEAHGDARALYLPGGHRIGMGAGECLWHPMIPSRGRHRRPATFARAALSMVASAPVF
jgi:hypothetical protein